MEANQGQDPELRRHWQYYYEEVSRSFVLVVEFFMAAIAKQPFSGLFFLRAEYRNVNQNHNQHNALRFLVMIYSKMYPNNQFVRTSYCRG